LQDKVVQDIARWRYYRTLKHEGTRGHCKTNVLEDLQDDGPARHCKTKVLQDISPTKGIRRGAWSREMWHVTLVLKCQNKDYLFSFCR
jgi:hypothetical protein